MQVPNSMLGTRGEHALSAKLSPVLYLIVGHSQKPGSKIGPHARL